MSKSFTSEISEFARRLAAQRRIVEGKCEVCGTSFTGTLKKRYCSHNCAQEAHIRNKAALAKTTDDEGQK